jgi:hypothetical protein
MFVRVSHLPPANGDLCTTPHRDPTQHTHITEGIECVEDTKSTNTTGKQWQVRMLYYAFQRLVQAHAQGTGNETDATAAAAAAAAGSALASAGLPPPAQELRRSNSSSGDVSDTMSRIAFHKILFRTVGWCGWGLGGQQRSAMVSVLMCCVCLYLSHQCMSLCVAAEMNVGLAEQHQMVDAFFGHFDVNKSVDIDFCEFAGSLATLCSTTTMPLRLASAYDVSL